MNFQRLQKEQYDDGYRSGLKDGEERGRAEGRDELAYMQSWLHEQGRDDDVMRTITDRAFCMEMLEAYRVKVSSDDI